MDDEEKKKEYLKNWQGDSRTKMQGGFNEPRGIDSLAKAKDAVVDTAKDAWQGLASLFVPKASAKKKDKDED